MGFMGFWIKLDWGGGGSRKGGRIIVVRNEESKTIFNNITVKMK